MLPLVRVVTSTESAARDAATIAAGTPGRALMARAGAAAAGEISLRLHEALHRGVLVLAGPGNNGGDGWVVARALAGSGYPVRVLSPAGARSGDCIAERALALPGVTTAEWEDGRSTYEGEGVVVDALLGTGATGAPRGPIAAAIELASQARSHGATVAALDVPSGVDATTGEAEGSITADLTITFGAMKRGLLIGRGRSGRIVVVDIGLGAEPEGSTPPPALVDERWVGRSVPPIGAEAHKGIRKKLAIIGGDRGMAGAAILASRAALRSGIGMVRAVVHADSVAAIQRAEPAALAAPWPKSTEDLDRDVLHWADAVVIGPGLGKSPEAEQLVRTVLSRWKKPSLIDADALNAFAGRLDELARLIGGTPALLTPHPAECARLVGTTVEDVLARRFEIGGELARRLRSAVLLKGVPTVISGPSGVRLVTASGNPALATGGSGDVLSGIGGTMLAQLEDPVTAGAVAAWVHGRAAERVAAVEHHIRGIVLEDVVDALGHVWTFDQSPRRYPVLCELEPVGEA